jgi:hypothetical protein
VKIIGEKKGGQNKNEKSEKQEQMEEGTNYLGQKNRKKNIREILAHLYHRISGHLDLALVGKKRGRISVLNLRLRHFSG